VIGSLQISDALRAQLSKEARDAFPRECCGLIEGTRDGATVKATQLHPTPNLAREPNRFEIDPALQFALMRALRGTDRDIIGCYHSHPNGRAEPSPHDLAEADEAEFIWLIAAISAETVSLEAHVFDGHAFQKVALQ
jgi:proteasome lid subunit RPN8/RPN11